jgi:hypothetical protein
VALDDDALALSHGPAADSDSWWHSGDADGWGGSGLWFPDDIPDDGGDDEG